MEEEIENPQAFPDPMRGGEHSNINQNPHEEAQGMTLRDYFAAKILQGIHANNKMWIAMCMDRKNCTRDNKNDTQEDYVAQQCYSMADAMLKERMKK